MSLEPKIPDQVRLPLRVAASVVAQGIRIRLGRSLVTLSGVVLGIAFLMSSFTAQAMRRGVASEDRVREAVNRMFGFFVAETGPVAGRSFALVVTSPPSALEARLLRRLEEDGARELRLSPGGALPPGSVDKLPTRTVRDGVELARDVPAMLVIGTGALPALDWSRALGAARQPLVAFAAARPAPAIPGATVVQLSRPESAEELATQAEDERRARFRSRWIMIISLLVTVIGISNSLLMSVTERFRDIGTMKCLGALSSFIRTTFLLEATLVGVLGGVVGVLAGFAFTLVSYFLPYGPALVSRALGQELGWLAGTALFSLAMGIGLSVVAALYPADAAARMVPADALRSNV